MTGALDGLVVLDLTTHLSGPFCGMQLADMGADVLVCSDHPEATEATVALVDRIEGLRGIDAGSMTQASAIEAFTAVLITVNIRHRVHAAVRLSGFDGA